MIALLVTGGLIAYFTIGQSICPSDSVVHPEAGGCIDPQKLVVTGSFEEVNQAVAEFDGTALRSRGHMRHVFLPVGDLEELDQIKAALEANGFRVEYAIVYETQ